MLCGSHFKKTEVKNTVQLFKKINANNLLEIQMKLTF